MKAKQRQSKAANGNDAASGPFSYEYIQRRLNRAIFEAQESDDFDEMARLQSLLWKLQDNKLSPVQVARAAWLQPATTTE